MVLDPSESINNMGTLRVDVLDGADLPAADRNGFSDPYCKFNLNGKEIYKTKVQKKTLHPAWNEFFECPVKSRTAAHFSVDVMDWDFADKADFLGAAVINLELLEPFKPKEVTLALDGKSGAVRLKMLFKPDYVTRSRQGSSTFSGTFATPGKVVGAPIKGVTMVGGGVAKGASFLRHGFKSKKDSQDIPSSDFVDPPREEHLTNGDTAMDAPQRATPILDSSPSTPITPPHKRALSFGGASVVSRADGTPAKAEAGTAQFLIQSATGYPPSSKIQVHIKQVAGKGTKEIHKTKAVKSSDGQVAFASEMFKTNCAPDTQFQIQVKDDKLLGGHDLGEAMFFINDSAIGQDQTVKVGDGTVVLSTTFVPTEAGLTDSPRSRRSFLSKRDRNVSGQSTQG